MRIVMTKLGGKSIFARVAAAAAMVMAVVAPAHAGDVASLESAFDSTFGTQARAPRTYDSPFEARLAYLADAREGRIGVAALDLATGKTVDILGSQRFPMASTSKIAIAATFLEGVDKGRWSLTSEFPLMIPVRSAAFSSSRAPVRKGNYLPAHQLIELMITRSSNSATDALLDVVGGPRAVNEWARRAGLRDFQLSRDIATLVRDDGEFDPATTIDPRDSATPLAMVELLSGLHQGKWLSAESRRVILGAMERCVTGKRRIPALLPEEARVAHKTGSLNNTSSDIGIIHTADGRTIAVAIYVTGQGTKSSREARIARIARAIYDGYGTGASSSLRRASR
jgi:beta-lactamase class A